MENKRFTLILEPISKRINVFEGSTVYKSILALNLPVGALCAGKGTCGKCLIRIVDPNAKISEPSEKEKKYLDNKKVLEGYRLACQTKILGDLRVFLTDSLMPKGYRILVDADLRTLGIKESDKITPIISSKLCKVASADLNNPKSDLSCLIEGISERDNNFKICENNRELHVNNILYRICKKLSKTIRKENGIVTAYFRKLFLKDSWILYDIDAGNKINKSFGLAIDIGTTTIVGYLIYLKTGEIVAISSMLNPHVAFGEDIISRIAYIIKNNGIEKAKNTLVSALNQILENCCEKTNISASCVKDISIVCNTGIHHMLFGLNPEFLSMSPYIPVFKAPTNISAHILGIKCNPNVNVYSPPVIAGYVGTDTIGCIISSKINTYDKYSLLIDIGTNG
ncbi:MAG: 2Fe-2S iron-sulfur cluster-binding protein, partial [Promethearchaeota archaeon]